MTMVERYLEAVAAQLSPGERDDIVAELRDLILSRIEAREEELGRTLSDDETEALLKEIGHPLVVAARYRKGPDSLIGPELFPYWLFGVKAGVLVLLAIQAVSLFVTLISGPRDAGQAIAQAFHGLFGAGLTLIGALTLAGAIMEHYGIRPKWLTEWRVKDVSAFGLSDPAAWGVAARNAGGRMKTDRTVSTPTLRPLSRLHHPGGEAAFSLAALTLFVLWWVGLVHFPGLGTMRIGGELVAVSGAPIWSLLFAPILLYALGQMAVELFTLIQPQAARVRALMSVGVAVAGMWLTWMIFDAGHWFTLSVGAEQARIAGDWVLLDFDRLHDLREGERDLVGVASTLSLIMSWALAISAVSLAYKAVANMWRAVTA